MRRGMIYVALGLAVVLTIGWIASPAFAVKEFKAEWDATYVRPGASDPAAKSLAAAAQEAKCYVCHMGKSKKERNPYGRELARLLKKDDKGNKEKIHAAFEKVADLKSDPKNASSPTYGDLIKQGKLPYPSKPGPVASR